MVISAEQLFSSPFSLQFPFLLPQPSAPLLLPPSLSLSLSLCAILLALAAASIAPRGSRCPADSGDRFLPAGAMEPQPADEPGDANSPSVLRAGSPSSHDLEVVESSLSSSPGSWVHGQQKRKRNQVAPPGVIVIDEDDEPAVVILGESASNNKQKQVVEGEHWQKQPKDVFADDLVGSSAYHASEVDISLETLKTIEAEYDYDDADGFEDDDYGYEEDDYDDYMFDDLNDNDSNLAAKFDDLDLPPGVEVTMSCWQKLSSGKMSESKSAVNADEIDAKFREFKQFDTVQDCSDHHFFKPENANMTTIVKKPPKDWSQRVQHEWKILENDLPETIFVRVYEERMDLLRAVIIGPAGTPYHDGLFFFDCCFSSTYPNTPPLVYYHSRGLRLNPNLYACGKVCLSLLGTWAGKGCEKWHPGKSTMLQVLVSIQALVLNAKPYFNEPGFEGAENTTSGERKSLAYNQDTFLLSCKTMLYTLQKPPKNFEHFVAGHFIKYGRTILDACKAYMEGARVGSAVGDGARNVEEGDKRSPSFRSQLAQLFEELLMEFTVKGADCDAFLAQKVKARLEQTASATNTIQPVV